MNIGSFDRGGRSRALTETEDHDYNPKTTVTPYGIFLPELDELFLYFRESQVTSDFIVDILENFWKSESWRFPDIKTLILNQDNGKENNSKRTQFMKRIVFKSFQSKKININYNIVLKLFTECRLFFLCLSGWEVEDIGNHLPPTPNDYHYFFHVNL